MTTEKKLAILAVGGNSLIIDETHKSVEDQYAAVEETCRHIAGLVKAGYRVVVTHGNGPQVGFILRRSELARPRAAPGAARLLRRRHAGRHRLPDPAGDVQRDAATGRSAPWSPPW